MNHFVYNMPLGRLTIAADDHAIKEVHFGALKLDCPRRPSALTNQAATQLQEYFSGKRTEFSVPVDPEGSEFQKAVWSQLQTIPYGQTRTYAQVAEAIGSPKSYRGVGMANNKNPIPILIPCHRVIGANGNLVGYAAGIKIKDYLLKLESEHALDCIGRN